MMKTVSAEHFERMQMMVRVFGERSQTSKLYLPEFEAAKKINEIIAITEVPVRSDFEVIMQILKEVDLIPHADGAAWLDYKIHVWATLRANGFKL